MNLHEDTELFAGCAKYGFKKACEKNGVKW